MMRLLLVLFLICAIPMVAAKGSGGPSPARAMQLSGKGGGGGAGVRGHRDSRPAPPMDEKRKVNEQDCTKPIDFTAGNLKCK
jgi:hypothetical protein